MTLTLASGVDYADLGFLGQPQVIATAILHAPAGVALVDPGPASCLEALGTALARRGIDWRDVRWLLLTHIHLDHAGGTGSIVRAHPHVEVVVHEAGAPHLARPERLLESARRLYGGDLERLWGEVAPVPEASLRVLRGGERLEAAGRTLETAWTPGHARHHVAYFDRASGIVFAGDTAGIRRPPGRYVMPPTPPPDIDLEAWRASVERLLAWRPSTLLVTHFGPYGDVQAHLAELLERLDAWSRRVRALVGRADLTEEERLRRFVEETRREMRRALTEEEVAAHDRAGRLDFSWRGLARYWRTRQPA
ncbi:MAG TPA: MBL fold metallo-hydrolase [Vicinamibacterales bacterium]|jgi:glyoxylase-like metal-dependent hydrolase (beta-lactamase superfamily II)|nr:MBL fold metallo-hydrolase [Vicinamibacterales bacterium]